MSGTIQVPPWPWRGVAEQAAMTAGKSWSKRISQPGVRRKRCRVLRSERESLNSATGSTMRGSVVHHSSGWPSPYQGKMPWR